MVFDKKQYNKDYWNANKDKLDKEALKQRRREYYIKNKAKLAEKFKKYAKENSSTISQYNKGYYLKNKDKIKKQANDYYLDNKEKVIDTHKTYVKSIEEKAKKYQKEYREVNADKIKIQMDKWRKRNHEKWINYCLDYMRKNPGKIRMSYEDIKLRRECYKRDGYKCFICKNKGGKGKIKLHAHHLDGWSQFPDKRHSLDNVITLCPNCHLQYHLQYGFVDIRREYFEMFAKSKFVQLIINLLKWRIENEL